AGFEQAQEPSVELRANDRRAADFQLKIGAVSQQMVVTAEAPQLDTESASHEQIVSERLVANTPIEGRNSFLLSTLTTGVYFAGTDAVNSIRPFDNGGMDAMQINGGLGFRNNFTLNGLPDTNSEGNGNPGQLTFVPPPDAVKEVNVESSAFDAQIGHTGGGNINVNFKNGTNQFHGSVYDYERNTIFNANRWENNALGQPRSAYHWHEPGIEVDGPLYLPKVVDLRNKVFWMFSWERIKDIIPQPLSASVPTAPERQGDFSQSGFTIYDPCNATLTYSAACSGNGARSPFAGDKIPVSRQNPVGLALLNSYPVPNAPGEINNYFYGASVVTDVYDAFTYNVDDNINEKNHMSFAYFQGDRHQVEPTYGYSNPAASPLYLHYRINHGGFVSLTSTLDPTLVWDTRFGFERHNFAVNPYSIGYDPSGLGFPASLVSQLASPAFPTVNVIQTNNGQALQTLGTTRPNGAASGTKTNTYALQSTLTKVISKHTVKFGTQFNVILNNYGAPAAPIFNFDSTFTQSNPTAPAAGQGNGWADMVLGYPTSGTVPIPGFFAYSSHYYAVFLQDDWRVNSRLTLNIGGRWDFESPMTERLNRLNSGFAYNTPSPLQVPGFRTLYGGLTFVANNDRAAYTNDYNNFQPRFGAAYRLTDKTVLRGGVGLYYLPTFDIPGTQGFSTTTNYVASINGNLTPANNLSNPYPTGIVQPTGNSLGLATLLGQSITAPYSGRTIPRNWQYSFSIQRQLPWNVMAEAGYVGSGTYQIETSVNIDTISAAQLAQYGSALNSTVANPFQKLLPGTSLNGSTIAREQAIVPYPQYLLASTSTTSGVTGVSISGGTASPTGGVIEQYVPIGRTWYNSMQARIEKRFSSGFYFLVSLTLSKNMQAMSFLNSQDATGGTGFLMPSASNHLLRQLTTSDQPYEARFSGGYELPFFRHSNGFLHSALGGWQINGVVNFIRGEPVAAPVGAYSTGLSPALSNSSGQLYFNNCYLDLSGNPHNCVNGLSPAWIQQPTFSLNTLTPVMPNVRLSRPALADVSLFKTFPIHERLQFQLRGEAFNVANTAWFPAPTTSLTSPNFGKTVLGTGGFAATSNDPRAIQLAARIMF
ncbi:MAG TPA: TonB-dependent receptor, partial [Bryobacteraceae bacterium]|nr:TonB-dependent receptor [Bryobacteraceae bacterium]